MTSMNMKTHKNLNKKRLVHLQPKRIFCFGCSFTDYNWGTWANIIGYEFNDAKFYNFGKSGAGNQYIFNMVMQADAIYSFTHEDLVMVQWTNVSREDRYFPGEWSTPGNIYSQDFYNDDWIKKYFTEYGAIVRDLAFIKAAHSLLEHRAQWHFIQMNNLVVYADQWDSLVKIDNRPQAFQGKGRIDELKEMYSEIVGILKPSFYDVLFNNNWNQKFTADRKIVNKNFQDGHPSPLEHYDYLNIIFKHDWKPQTTTKVSNIQKRWIELMNNASHSFNKDKFSIYKQPKRWTDMVRKNPNLVRKNQRLRKIKD